MCSCTVNRTSHVRGLSVGNYMVIENIHVGNPWRATEEWWLTAVQTLSLLVCSSLLPNMLTWVFDSLLPFSFTLSLSLFLDLPPSPCLFLFCKLPLTTQRPLKVKNSSLLYWTSKSTNGKFKNKQSHPEADSVKQLETFLLSSLVQFTALSCRFGTNKLCCNSDFIDVKQ